MEKMSMIYSALLELQAEIVWDEAVDKFQEEKLHQAIDQALLRRDKLSFLKLTGQLRSRRQCQLR